MTYDPKKVRFVNVVSGSAVVGLTLQLGVSSLGVANDVVADVPSVSSIELTDGYNVADGNALSIDPSTGTAAFSERVNPGPSTAVEEVASAHTLAKGSRWQLWYGTAFVAQGRILGVETDVSTEGSHWIKKTKYVLGGAESAMLNTTVSWAPLSQEGALIRLKRFFTVDTSLLTGAQIVYLDTCLAPAESAGSSTLLDLARAFTGQTLFPVRTGNLTSAATLVVVPAVKYKGADPAPLAPLPPERTWTLAADFLSETAGAAGVLQHVEIVKDYDGFISGVATLAVPGAPIGAFVLGSDRIGGPSLTVDVGVRAPAVVNLYGTIRIIHQIKQSFTSEHYRSSIDLAVPAEVT